MGLHAGIFRFPTIKTIYIQSHLRREERYLCKSYLSWEPDKKKENDTIKYLFSREVNKNNNEKISPGHSRVMVEDI